MNDYLAIIWVCCFILSFYFIFRENKLRKEIKEITGNDELPSCIGVFFFYIFILLVPPVSLAILLYACYKYKRKIDDYYIQMENDNVELNQSDYTEEQDKNLDNLSSNNSKSDSISESKDSIIEDNSDQQVLFKEENLKEEIVNDGKNYVWYVETEDKVECFFKPIDDTYMTTRSIVENYTFVKEGDALQYLYRYARGKFGSSMVIKLFAEHSGIYVNSSSYLDKLYDGYKLYKIFANEMSFFNEKYKDNKLEIREDDFTKTKKIQGISFAGDVIAFRLINMALSIEYACNKHTLIISYNPSDFRLSKKDNLQFLLEDGSILLFNNFTTPIKSHYFDKNVTTSASLSDNDIIKLSTKKCCKWRVVNDESVVVYECVFSLEKYGKEISQALFKDFMMKYLQLYMTITPKETVESSLTQSNRKCYVYLMVDTTNNFYKIGISNNPKYREHTLQSDKPTIDLICAKEYPSRTIAESIESALHKAYASKRIRGEWFSLSLDDINDIKTTLK